jgi:methylmalonyl-CoA mutase cobalamin-binding subunit
MELNDALSRIPWQDFEILVANRYRRHGWQVAHCGEGRAESEVDLRMRRHGDVALVQCRHESFLRLDARTVERLLATAAEAGASQVIVITSGEVPEPARQRAESAGAAIIEGEAVRAMLDDDLLELQPLPSLAGIDEIIVNGKAPRGGRGSWRAPLFFAALAVLGFLAVFGARIARSGMEHPLPPQVDPAVLTGAAAAPADAK